MFPDQLFKSKYVPLITNETTTAFYSVRIPTQFEEVYIMPRAYVHSSQEHTCSRLRTMYAAMDMSISRSIAHSRTGLPWFEISYYKRSIYLKYTGPNVA